MANYEAQIHTRFGLLTIHFDSSEEFLQRVRALDISTIISTIQDHLSGVVIREPRSVKPLIAGVCAFTPDGGLEFLKPPSEKLEAIGILLYAYDPDPVDTRTVRKVVAEKNPAGYLGHKQYKQYFEKVEHGVYRLSHKGKLWVTNEIIPKLMGHPEKEK